MLQQTQRERVAPKYRAFMLRFPDLAALARASAADVIREWAGLGYNSRALRLHQAARRIMNEPGGCIPPALGRLRELPGVGEYTARAILCFGFNQPVACVDTNVRRVLRRIFDGRSEAPSASSADNALAERVLVRGRAADWNAALMDLGALVCRARAPSCGHCPVSSWCAARPRLASEDSAPRKVAEASATYGAKPRRAHSQAPFAASDRFLRGRIVDVLRRLPDGEALPLADLALLASGMALPPQTERVARLADRLVRIGLIEGIATGGETRFRLPA
ncbi:MAG TPA: A/G-specific adenine glycosylase [Dehalococcoidia bacterium]|nr:A/G-specific adenine glycosylase [Dehalococcoidia bacterium]